MCYVNFWSFLAANYRDIMLREFPEFFALLLAANNSDIVLREIPEFFALFLTANYRDIMLRELLEIFANSLKEIHSFAPSFNPSRATR